MRPLYCTHAIDQEHFSLTCRRTRGHQDPHAWWSSGSRVEWGDGGTVLTSVGMKAWKQGERYPTRLRR